MESSHYLLREYISENEESVGRCHSDKQPIYISLILSTPGPSTVGRRIKKGAVSRRLAVWRCWLQRFVAREYKPLVASVRYKQQPETCL